MLRERFDRIEIIDLRGDLRRGERAGVLNDEGVFNIQVGTAITVALADGSKAKGDLAEITYADCWEENLQARRAKLDYLETASVTGSVATGVAIQRGILEDFKPRPFQTIKAPSIADCFKFKNSGIETTRDHLAYDLDAARLERKIRKFLALSPGDQPAEFSVTRKASMSAAISRGFERKAIKTVAYRPLDARVLLNLPEFVDWPRPELQKSVGRR
jgi:predicted helicase